MHIGLIGGIGPAATEFYYRHISAAHARAGRPLDLTIVNADAPELVANLRGDHRDRQAATFERLTRRLQAAGAEQVAITSIAGHFCHQEFAAVSPLPMVSIVPAVHDALTARGVTRVGLIGTTVAMASRVYGALDGFDVRVPGGDDFMATDREYLGMGTTGRVTDEHRAFFFRIGRRLYDEGAEVIVLGGTDLYLVFDGQECGFPTVDCALAHIDAITAQTLAG
ncbi:MAG: aspartate/glutamate racemase family protein [Vicinamibacterales bacterium]